jgi:hypothetical protein
LDNDKVVMRKSNQSYFSSVFSWRGDNLKLSRKRLVSSSKIEPMVSTSRSNSTSSTASNSSPPTNSITRLTRQISVKSSVKSPPKANSLSPPKAASSASAGGNVVCDKCDGKHETSKCPHFKKDRGDHPDAQKNFYKKLGGTSTLPGAVIRNGRVARQPGDGSCLFHSMSFGLRDGTSASSLRRDICSFLSKNPNLKIADTPLSDWIKWDSGGSVSSYTSRMSGSAWGGGIEMAAVSMMKGVNVHVYERSARGFTRISAFDYPDNAEGRKTIRVLYCGGVHYGT